MSHSHKVQLFWHCHRLRDELDELVGQRTFISYDDIMKMEYASMVIKVLLKLLARACVRACVCVCVCIGTVRAFVPLVGQKLKNWRVAKVFLGNVLDVTGVKYMNEVSSKRLTRACCRRLCVFIQPVPTRSGKSASMALKSLDTPYPSIRTFWFVSFCFSTYLSHKTVKNVRFWAAGTFAK